MNTQENKINNIETDEQVAQVVAGFLKDNAQHLNVATLQRLSTARNLAVNQLAARQTQTAGGISQSSNVLQWLGHGFGSYFGHHRMMSTAMLAGVVMLTFFAAQQFDFGNNGLNNLESGDAFLLASELPPEAFADKGFDTWVVSRRD